MPLNYFFSVSMYWSPMFPGTAVRGRGGAMGDEGHIKEPLTVPAL